ncbi:hypothetical protein [Lysobacter sp. A289]
MTGLRTTIGLGVLLALTSCLAGCGERSTPVSHDTAATEALPEPGPAGDSVTGMPAQPGPGQIGSPPPLSQAPVDTAIGSNGRPDDDGGLPLSAPMSPGTSPGRESRPDESGPDQAVAVVRAYYEAINTGHHDQAYRLWSDHGKASGQSPLQFADGFDDTVRISVEVMAPGRVDPAAGSRYIEVPIALRATHRDGSIHQYVGAYTLRRAVVDGATEEQRAWRIASADIREIRP